MIRSTMCFWCWGRGTMVGGVRRREHLGAMNFGVDCGGAVSEDD